MMKNLLISILLIIVFLGAPLTFHYFIPTSLIAGILTVSLLGLLIIGKHSLNKFEILWLLVWISYAFGLFILSSVHFIYGVNEFRKFLGVFVKLLFIINALILTRIYLYSIVRYLNAITVIQLLLITIGLVIIFLKIIKITPVEIILENGRKFYHYYITGASNTIIRFSKQILIRPTGFFEEPGALALFLSWILILNEFTYKNKKLVIIIVVLGMVLRSLAFVITLIVFFTIRVMVKKDLKFIFKIMLSFAIFIIFLVSLDLPHIEYAIDTIIHRISVHDGNLGGDNRRMSEMFEYINLNNIFFGVGGENVRKIHYAGGPTAASAAGFLLTNGLFGYIFLYLPFLYVLFIYRNDKKIFYFAVITINFLQRPGIDELYIMLIMTLLVQLKNPKLKKKAYAVFNNNN